PTLIPPTTSTPPPHHSPPSLHDALPISSSEYVDPEDQPASTMPYTPIEVTARIYSTATGISVSCSAVWVSVNGIVTSGPNGITRSEEHTSELQSRFDLVCRLLLAKK